MNWNNKEEVREYMREYRRTHNSNKKYYDSHKEEILKKNKEYRLKNADKIKEYRDKNKEKIKEYRREYKNSHREEAKEYNKRYYLEHRESELKRKTEYQKEYSKTQMGRAQHQIQQYKFMDKRNGFGDDKIDFNARWIVENIYSKPCAHCGETDWHKLGCNRIDNSKPHTKDNVEPCCFHCNCVLNGLECSDRLSSWSKENLTGKKRPDISERLKGKKRPDVSLALTGRKLSEEHKKKISESMKAKAKRGR